MKNYAPDDIVVTIGTHVAGGFADGTFVTVARQNDSFSSTAGADGEVARARSNDKRGTITLTVLQTSLTNRFLSTLLLLDENTGGGIVPVVVRDRNGNTLHVASEAWVQKPADAAYSKEIESREWVLECAVLEYFEDGKSPVAA